MQTNRENNICIFTCFKDSNKESVKGNTKIELISLMDSPYIQIATKKGLVLHASLIVVNYEHYTL